MLLARSHPRPYGSTVADQWRRVVDDYRRSGLTQREFCQQAGVTLSQLNWWLTKARRQAEAAASMGFTEVRPGALMAPVPPTPPPPTWALEIVTPEGVTIRSREAVSVADLLRGLRDRRC